jgi:hypothetical protein
LICEACSSCSNELSYNGLCPSKCGVSGPTLPAAETAGRHASWLRCGYSMSLLRVAQTTHK